MGNGVDIAPAGTRVTLLALCFTKYIAGDGFNYSASKLQRVDQFVGYAGPGKSLAAFYRILGDLRHLIRF
jgi:hypothetical protein